MAIQEIFVRHRIRDNLGNSVKREAERTLGISGIDKVSTARVYRLEGVTSEQAEFLAKKLFQDPITEEVTIGGELIEGAEQVVEVAYKPGVMNPEVGSILKAAKDLGVPLAAADSSTQVGFHGQVSEEDVRRITNRFLVNPTVQHVITQKPDTLIITGERGLVTTVPIANATEEELVEISRDKLFLNVAEMRVVQEYFRSIGRNPTDCELEIIAARWSEHCVHKTFKARVLTEKGEKPPFFERIKTTARKYFRDFVVSAFEDNSGVIDFYDGITIAGKVETHNAPSAIEPRGGAATGSGGVFRDIAGTGQGGKVILSTDIFCFGPPDTPGENVPLGCLHPDYIQRGVVTGVEEYGNRMGIPTSNGSVHYHPDFTPKPTVIVGSYGEIPKDKAQKGQPKVGDLAVLIGGRTGRDGIHGATFSSGEMTERTVAVNSSAVQIGNAIEEKRILDAILEARDLNLIRAITDCGAAGLSSAVGEIGEETGVDVDISNVPLKYSGLAPWEIWLSESQERMVLAIDPQNREEFLKVCQKYNVEASVLGYFDGSNRLKVRYQDEVVADLDYEFLKHGLPQREMTARWQKFAFEEKLPEQPADWVETLKKVLSHGNVCSKEPITRKYDTSVQGTNAMPPFSGVNFDGPNDAVVLTPILDKPYGLVVAHGLNPILNRIDPYYGSLWAVAEAVSNYVSAGGNIREAALINNYISPVPDEQYMGALDKQVDAVVDAMNALGVPVVSGKDSLSSTYKGKDGRVINIPPVLCISVFGRIPDVEKTVTTDIKKAGSILVLVGRQDGAMGGSTYYDINETVGNEVPKVDFDVLSYVLDKMHVAIRSGRVLSSHDVSEGGVITTVVEMCFGGDCGVDLDIKKGERPDMFLFNETAGCFVVEIENEKTARELFDGVPFEVLGRTKREKTISVKNNGQDLFVANIDKLKVAWKKPLEEIFA